MTENDKLQVFEDQTIRTAWDEEKEEWYFSVVDVVVALTESPDYKTGRKYWNKLKQRLKEEGNELVTNCHQLKMKAADGKRRLTDVANTEQLLRIIQSIPSRKAEPFKMWLAMVGRERIEEIIDPELTIERALDTYAQKGYPPEWINQRLQTIRARKELTTKQLVYSAVAIALAVVCSMIKLFEMPMGGSVTLLSMLFIVLIAYWYGPYVGIMTAVAYGLVQFVTEPIFYTIPQMLLDYPLAFGALGLAGFFNKKKWGLQIGYVVGVFGRFIFSTISGIVFFASYAPEGMNPILYSLGYQASYLVPEAVITLIIISIPPVAKALARVKQNAVEA